MQTPAERKSLQDFILEKYLDWFQQHKTEEDFFEKNWTLTKGTMLCPTALPEDILQNLCQCASDVAKEKNLNAVEVLFPSIAIESISDDYPDLSQLDILKLCQTHILSQDAQYLLPVKLLCQKTPGVPTFNPYYDFEKSDQAEVTPLDWQQMIHHSQTTESYQDIIQQISDLEHKTDNLYIRLKQFCTTLHLNDAHGGRGGDLNAGSGAYPAIIGFYEYFNLVLSESEKQKLPQELRKELQLLYAFSTDSEQNKNATVQIATCIGMRREAIERAMKGHEPMLREIGISGEQQSRLQQSLADQKQHLEQIIQSTQYAGREQLSFNQSLLQSLNVQLTFQSPKDLQLLIPISFTEFKQIVDNNPRLLSCCDFDEFIDWTHHLSAEKIEYLVDKFDMRNLVYHPMHFHEWMLQLDDNQMISALILMAKYLKFQSYDFSFLDFNQILDDMGKLDLIPKLINKLESLGIEEELLFAIYSDKPIKYSTKYLFGDGLRTRLFNLLPKERMLELITAEDRTGKKIMHSLTISQLQDIFLNYIPQDKVFDSLRITDAYKKSYFKILINLNRKILTRISKDQLAQLLIENPEEIMNLTNNLELTALNKMLELLPEQKYAEVLNRIETSVSTFITIARSSDEAFQLLLKQLTFAKWTQLIDAICTHKDNILQFVKPNRLFECMIVKGTDQTIFEYIVKTNPVFLVALLQKLHESQGTKLFDNLFSQVNPSILYFAASSHIESFKHLWKIIPEEKRLEWLIKKNTDGQTLLDVLNFQKDPRFILELAPYLFKIVELWQPFLNSISKKELNAFMDAELLSKASLYPDVFEYLIQNLTDEHLTKLLRGDDLSLTDTSLILLSKLLVFRAQNGDNNLIFAIQNLKFGSEQKNIFDIALNNPELFELLKLNLSFTITKLIGSNSLFFNSLLDRNYKSFSGVLEKFISKSPDDMYFMLSLLEDRQLLSVMNKRDSGGHTFLHHAAKYPELITVMLKHLTNMKIQDGNISTFMMNSIKSKDCTQNSVLSEFLKHPQSFRELVSILEPKSDLYPLIKKELEKNPNILSELLHTKDILKSLIILYPEQERLELAKTLIGQSNGESKVYLERFTQVKDCQIDEVIALLQRKCKKYPDRSELIVQYIETLTALKQHYLDEKFDCNQFKNKFITALEHPPDLNYYRSRSQSIICLPTNLSKKFQQLRTSIVSHERAANPTALARHSIFQEGGEPTSENKPEKHL